MAFILNSVQRDIHIAVSIHTDSPHCINTGIRISEITACIPASCGNDPDFKKAVLGFHDGDGFPDFILIKFHCRILPSLVFVNVLFSSMKWPVPPLSCVLESQPLIKRLIPRAVFCFLGLLSSHVSIFRSSCSTSTAGNAFDQLLILSHGTL